jgi:hypothetical protein
VRLERESAGNRVGGDWWRSCLSVSRTARLVDAAERWGGGGGGNVKALHAVKDPLTPAAMRVNVKNKNKPRRQGHLRNELFFVFPAFELLQMARCHTALVPCLRFSQSTILSSGLRRH